MDRWKLDPAHSEVKFKASHLLVATVTGEFKGFDEWVEAEGDNFKKAGIYFEADVNSIDTGNEQRDAHLKSADFFDAEQHPRLTFESKSIKKISDNIYEIKRDLTIRGITKEVVITAEHTGTANGFGGVTVAGFEIKGIVNRFDYGLKWNALTETGGVVVGEEIRIEINAELNKVEAEVKEEAEADK